MSESISEEPGVSIFRVEDKERGKQILPKFWYLPTKLQGVTSQNVVILLFMAAKTSNPT
jgi:hypothetical protein